MIDWIPAYAALRVAVGTTGPVGISTERVDDHGREAIAFTMHTTMTRHRVLLYHEAAVRFDGLMLRLWAEQVARRLDQQLRDMGERGPQWCRCTIVPVQP